MTLVAFTMTLDEFLDIMKAAGGTDRSLTLTQYEHKCACVYSLQTTNFKIPVVEGEWIGNGAHDPYIYLDIYAYYAVLYRRVSLLLFLEDGTSLAYDVYCEYY